MRVLHGDGTDVQTIVAVLTEMPFTRRAAVMVELFKEHCSWCWHALPADQNVCPNCMSARSEDLEQK